MNDDWKGYGNTEQRDLVLQMSADVPALREVFHRLPQSQRRMPFKFLHTTLNLSTITAYTAETAS